METSIMISNEIAKEIWFQLAAKVEIFIVFQRLGSKIQIRE